MLEEKDLSPAGSLSAADTGWRVFFTDPHLQKLIETGACQQP